jgi:TPR repeat protein
MKWFRLAAALGDGEAFFNLGIMYESGQGVPPDDVRAHMWFDLAAQAFGEEQGKGAAANRDAAADRMTPAQIDKAKAMAKACLESSYQQCN